MYQYKTNGIEMARTRDEMFKEEALILQQETLDVLTQIRDLLQPKTVEQVNEELKLTLVEKPKPVELPTKTKTSAASKAKPRGKKEVK